MRKLQGKDENTARTRKYLNEEEAAKFLCVAERTLRDWRSKGLLDNKGTPPPKSYKRGKHIYYELSELDAWVRSGANE